MLKIRPISSFSCHRIIFGLTLIFSILSFSASANSTTNYHQTPQQSELLVITKRKKRSTLFSILGVIRSISHFFLNHSILEKVKRLLFSELCKVQLLVLTSQYFLKEFRPKLVFLKMPSTDSEGLNLNFF